MKFEFEIYGLVHKPVKDVFDAVYNPQKLSRYFTTKGASAPLKAGTTVMWDFADFPGAFPVHVKKSVKNKRIVFNWQAADGDYNTRVTFTFERMKPRVTKVTIAETGWRNNPRAQKSSYMNCFGWSQMLCCLRVYLEHGFNLREGFFK